jgi:hypothetical protein
MTAVFSQAEVATATPNRYAKQLVSHLGRKLSFEVDGAVSTATIGGATGQIIVGDGVLTLTAAGDDPAAVAVVEDVLGGTWSASGRATNSPSAGPAVGTAKFSGRPPRRCDRPAGARSGI